MTVRNPYVSRFRDAYEIRRSSNRGDQRVCSSRDVAFKVRVPPISKKGPSASRVGYARPLNVKCD
jgi:hypothetical protein